MQLALDSGNPTVCHRRFIMLARNSPESPQTHKVGLREAEPPVPIGPDADKLLSAYKDPRGLYGAFTFGHLGGALTHRVHSLASLASRHVSPRPASVDPRQRALLAADRKPADAREAGESAGPCELLPEPGEAKVS